VPNSSPRPQIGAQDPETLGGKRPDQLVPLPLVLRKAVRQHHRRAGGRPGVGDINRHTTAQIDKPVLHASEFRK
jgi:hypothetical protein